MADLSNYRADMKANGGRLPRSYWGDGPWQDEPDRDEWRHAGLPCLARRGPHGNWCGYVAVPPGHPLHGVAYGQCTKGCDESFCDDRVDQLLDVHGGLTYSASCQEDAPEGEGICHVPREGEPGDVWWFGFDCGHAFDVCPASDALIECIYAENAEERWNRRGADTPAAIRETYKALPYVKSEIEHLADQLAVIA